MPHKQENDDSLDDKRSRLNSSINKIKTLTKINPVANNNYKSIKEVVENFQGAKHPLLDYAVNVARDAQFPVSTAILTALASFSATAGLVYCTSYPNGHKLPLGLYLIAEQPPATSKSRVLSTFNTPALRAVTALNKARATKNKDIELDNKEKTDSMDKTDNLPIINILAGNITSEALEQSQVTTNGGYFSCSSAEQGLLNSMLGLSRGSGHVNINDLILSGFNGEWYSSSRITRKGFSGVVHGGFLCLAQDGSIRTVLDQSNSTGIAERFIFCAEKNLLGTRNFINWKKHVHESETERYELAVNRIVNMIDSLPNLKPELDHLYVINLSSKSWESINSYRQDKESKIADGEIYSHSVMRGIIGKLDIQVMKLAATLHISYYAMEPLNDKTPETVDHQWVELTLQMIEVHTKQVYELLNDMGIMGTTAKEEAVISFFSAKNRDLTVSEIKQYLRKVKIFKDSSGNIAQEIEDTVSSLCLKKILHTRQNPSNNVFKFYM